MSPFLRNGAIIKLESDAKIDTAYINILEDGGFVERVTSNKFMRKTL